MKTFLPWMLITGLTGSPVLGFLVVLLLWGAGGSWFVGRLPDFRGPVRRWQRARFLRDRLTTNPHDLPARTELAGLVCDSDPAEAITLLGDVLRRYPEDEDAHYFGGLAHLAAGRLAEGHAGIDRALALRADLRWGEPAVRLGDAYVRAGKHAQARDAYLRATTVHASHAEAWFKSARAALATGDRAEAKRLWEATLSTTAGAPPYKRRKDRLWRWRAWWGLRNV